MFSCLISKPILIDLRPNLYKNILNAILNIEKILKVENRAIKVVNDKIIFLYVKVVILNLKNVFGVQRLDFPMIVPNLVSD